MSRDIARVADLILAAAEARLQFGTDLWWRGHASGGWSLLPSVFRDGRDPMYESTIAHKFLTSAPSRHRSCPPMSDNFAWLTLMQQYRLPTRLLDWTEAPLTALYFAVTEHPRDDGAVWILSPFILNEVQVSDDRALTFNHPEVIAASERALGGVRGGPPAIAVTPTQIDPRMLAQQAAFTLHSQAFAVEDLRQHERFVARCGVPAGAKEDILNELALLAIHRRNLFPDLENLALDLSSGAYGARDVD